jgi:imidazolonepropionase-like amidohydrolase
MSIRATAFLLLVSTSVCVPGDALAQSPIAFIDATIIDPSARPSRFTGTIIIDRDRIAAVGSTRETSIPPGATRIDARGKFVMPGLIDVHNHLRYGDAAPVEALAKLPYWGVTTAFNPVMRFDAFVAVKRLIAADSSPRARFFSAGRSFGAENGWGGSLQAGFTPKSADEARANIREAAASGVDAIKLMNDDMQTFFKNALPVIDPDVMAAIIDEAHAQALKAYVHAPELAAAKAALRAGADALMHGIASAPVDDEFIELMRANGACYVPTQWLYECQADTEECVRRLEAFDQAGLIDRSRYEQERSPELLAALDANANKAHIVAQLPVLRNNLKRVLDAGIPIAMGTDTGLRGVVLGSASQMELLIYVEAGMTAEQALRSATVDAARMIGVYEELGSIEAGKLADLVVLSADPLEDIRNIRAIEAVYVNGVLLDQQRD